MRLQMAIQYLIPDYAPPKVYIYVNPILKWSSQFIPQNFIHQLVQDSPGALGYKMHSESLK